MSVMTTEKSLSDLSRVWISSSELSLIATSPMSKTLVQIMNTQCFDLDDTTFFDRYIVPFHIIQARSVFEHCKQLWIRDNVVNHIGLLYTMGRMVRSLRSYEWDKPPIALSYSYNGEKLKDTTEEEINQKARMRISMRRRILSYE